jgi:hypothetical protein
MAHQRPRGVGGGDRQKVLGPPGDHDERDKRGVEDGARAKSIPAPPWRSRRGRAGHVASWARGGPSNPHDAPGQQCQTPDDPYGGRTRSSVASWGRSMLQSTLAMRGPTVSESAVPKATVR